MARFKFYIFNLSTGFPILYEEVTQDITLTGRDRYTGTITYDLFNAEGRLIAPGCRVNIDRATRVTLYLLPFQPCTPICAAARCWTSVLPRPSIR
jgi:hypothetical protein